MFGFRRSGHILCQSSRKQFEWVEAISHRKPDYANNSRHKNLTNVMVMIDAYLWDEIWSNILSKYNTPYINFHDVCWAKLYLLSAISSKRFWNSAVYLNPGLRPSKIGWCLGKTVLLQIYWSRTLNKSSLHSYYNYTRLYFTYHHIFHITFSRPGLSMVSSISYSNNRKYITWSQGTSCNWPC